MAIQYENTSSYLERTTDLLNFNVDYTVMFWINHLNLNRGFYSLFQLASFGGPNNWDLLYVDNTTQNIYFEVALNGVSTGVQISTGVYGWSHIALRRNNSSGINLIVNGNKLSPASPDVITRPAITHQRFNKVGFNEGFPNAFCQFYLYNAAISDKEIEDQRYFSYPRKTENLREWLPMNSGADRNKDFSGNNRHYTESGIINNADDLILANTNLLSYKLPPIYYASPTMLMNF